HPGIASCASAVVDDDGLAERHVQRRRQNAGNDVGWPAGRKRHDQRDRPLRPGGAGGGGKTPREQRHHDDAEGEKPRDFTSPRLREVALTFPRMAEKGEGGISTSLSVGERPLFPQAWGGRRRGGSISGSSHGDL